MGARDYTVAQPKSRRVAVPLPRPQPGGLLWLQATAGNRAVSSLVGSLRSASVQRRSGSDADADVRPIAEGSDAGRSDLFYRKEWTEQVENPIASAAALFPQYLGVCLHRMTEAYEGVFYIRRAYTGRNGAPEGAARNTLGEKMESLEGDLRRHRGRVIAAEDTSEGENKDTKLLLAADREHAEEIGKAMVA